MQTPPTSVLDTVMVWLLTPVYFLFIITIIATIHEYGHYIIAKMLGVRVDEFSIGFGKLLFSKKWGETEYNLRAIPIAAYVRPAGMDPAEEEQEGWIDPGERSFHKKNSLIKYAILFGGSLFNLISAVAFLTLLYMYVGISEIPVAVNTVSENGPAHVGGIRVGDVIVQIDGKPVKDTERTIRLIKSRPGEKIEIVVQRSGRSVPLTITPENNDGEGRIGVGFDNKGTIESTVLVKEVTPNGPAGAAGLLVNDEIIEVDGKPIKDALLAMELVQKRAGESVALTVKRGGEKVPLKLVPAAVDGARPVETAKPDADAEAAARLAEFIKAVGFTFVPDPQYKGMRFWPAFLEAKDKTWEMVQQTYSSALKMFTRSFTKKEIPKDVGGPVAIVGAVGSHVRRGMHIPDMLWILAMLSLAIGVFNLLPIPALDGGRILVLFVRDVLDLGYTLVFWRRPRESLFSHRIEEYVHLIGILLLLLLLVFVTFKDVRELFTDKPAQQMPVYPSPGASGQMPAPASPFASPR